MILTRLKGQFPQKKKAIRKLIEEKESNKEKEELVKNY
jgi:hypothetical protein